jgi:hypothetical protein
MNVYEIVTDRIVNLLESGIVPWRQPWAAAGLPHNIVSKKPYRGVNLFLLSATKHVSPYWLTMKQANQLGGYVRKGEQSQIAVFWKVDQAPAADGETNSEERDADEKGRRRFVLKFYRIFNLEQCELPPAVLDKLPKKEGFLDLLWIGDISCPEDATLSRSAQSRADLFQGIGVTRQRYRAVACLRKGFDKTRANARTDPGNDRYFTVRHIHSSMYFS